MDEEKIQAAIKHFKFYATPNNMNSSSPATVEDINNLIKETAKLIDTVAKAMKD